MRIITLLSLAVRRIIFLFLCILEGSLIWMYIQLAWSSCVIFSHLCLYEFELNLDIKTQQPNTHKRYTRSNDDNNREIHRYYVLECKPPFTQTTSERGLCTFSNVLVIRACVLIYTWYLLLFLQAISIVWT